MNARRKSAPLLLSVSAVVLAASFAAAQAPPAFPGPITLVPPSAPAAGPVDRTIEMDDLGELSVDRIGLGDTLPDPLPDTMWEGSDPELVRAALSRLPRRLEVMALRTLARRLLLPAATPPQAADPIAAAILSTSDGISATDLDAPAEPDADVEPLVPTSGWLFQARVKALAAIGAWPDAGALIDLAPPDKLDAELRKIKVDALIVQDNLDAACGETQVQLATAPEPYWQKVQVLCQYHGKQTAAANLGVSLLQEQAVEDPAFFWAADLMQGNRPLTPSGLTRVEPVVLAMLRLANRPVPDSVLREGDPTALRIAALMPPVPPAADEKLTDAEKKDRAQLQEGARIAFAERAVAAGTLAPADLTKLYIATDFTADEKPPQLTQITAEDARGRAFMYQLAVAQNVPTARAEVIARASELARADHGVRGPALTTVGLVYVDLVAEIAPTPDLIWFTGHAVRLFMAAGQPQLAAPWMEMVTSMARTNIEAGEIADSLWAITHLAHQDDRSSSAGQEIVAWQKTLSGSGALAQRETMLNLMVAIGDRVTTENWLQNFIAGARPRDEALPAVNVWHALGEASRDARLGETAALSLIAAGNNNFETMSPLTLGRIIEALMAAGREQDARALAVEAALMAGL